MVHGLNLFERPLVSVLSLDSYLLCDLHLIISAFMLERSHMLSFFFYKSLLVFLVFVDLTLFDFLFFFSVLKNSKTHKKLKISKSLISCIVYITCEFSLVLPY